MIHPTNLIKLFGMGKNGWNYINQNHIVTNFIIYMKLEVDI